MATKNTGKNDLTNTDTNREVLLLEKKITCKHFITAGAESATLAAMIRRRETVTTAFGESTKFVGDFALKFTDKSGQPTQIRAGTAYVPEILENLFNAALDSGEEGEVVQGVFRIQLVKSDKSKTGCTYQVSPVTEVKASDPMQNLLALA